jgi:hypothetical protein
MHPSALYWLKYPVATACLIAFLTVIGLPAFAIVRQRLPDWGLLLVPILGLAWAIVLVSWYARLGEALHWWVVWAAFAASAAASIVIAIRVGVLARLRASPPSLRTAAAAALSYGGPWALGVAFVTAFLVPVITSPFQPSGFMTTFTLGNNDLGSYIAEATNVAKAGFANAHLFYGWDPGTNPSAFSANVDHTGADSLLALFGTAVGGPVWKVGQLAMMVGVAGMYVGSVALVRAAMPEVRRGALVIAAFGPTSFMVWYLVGEYFLAQIICLCLVLTQLAVIVGARDRLLDWRVVATLTPLAAATWLTSPELQAVFALLAGAVVVSGFLAAIVTKTAYAVRMLLARTAVVATSVSLGALLIAPFMGDLIDRLHRVYGSTAGQVGWPVDMQNGALLLLGYPDSIGSHSALGWFAAIGVALLLLGSMTWALVMRDRVGIAAGAFCLVLIAAVTYGAHRWGWAAYQSWKLILTLSVPFLALAGVLILRPLRADHRRAALVVLAVLVGVNLQSGARTWNPVPTSPELLAAHSVGAGLVTFLHEPRVQRQSHLNIYVPTLFNTMVAPTVFGKTAALSSPSYLSGIQPGAHPYACSLVDATMYRRDLGSVAYSAHGLLLVNTPRCS